MHNDSELSFLNKQLDHIDLDHALQKGGGKAQNLLKIVGMFVQHHSKDLADLQQNKQDKDYESAGRVIHTLAGIASFVGALGLEKRAQAYNNAIHSGEMDKLESLLDDVLLNLPLVLTDLNTIVASQDSTEG